MYALIVCYLPGFIASNSYEIARFEIAALKLQNTQNKIIIPSKRIVNLYNIYYCSMFE